MADRHTLHKGDLENFKKWLVTHGWDILPTKGDHEVLRARRDDWPRPLLVYEKVDGGDHYSIDERDLRIYRTYFNEKRRKHRGRPRESSCFASG